MKHKILIVGAAVVLVVCVGLAVFLGGSVNDVNGCSPGSEWDNTLKMCVTPATN